MIVCSALLAGCAGSDRLTTVSGAARTDRRMPAAAAGHSSTLWSCRPMDVVLGGTGSCAMTFGTGQDATEGTIAPAGGCPVQFLHQPKMDL